MSCVLKRGTGKQMKWNKKVYKALMEHIGKIPLVMVSPNDQQLITGGSDLRRKFIDGVISQTDHAYLDHLIAYNKALEQRNRLLKDGGADPALLDVFDQRMSALAVPVFEARKQFAEQLSPVVRDYYAFISGGGEQVGIEYRSDLEKGSLEDILRERRDRDAAMRFTTAGLQRDDFLFTLNGHPIRKCGSQGQQKSFLVALKFAQYEIMKRNYGFTPILLLDDLFDKLDLGRISNLLKMVAGQDFGQIFLSDCNKVRMSAIVDEITKDRAYFEAEGGSFKRL